MRKRFVHTLQTLSLAWPIMVTQIAQVGTGFVDATMAGHYSSIDLAAISVGGSIWVTLMVTLIGLTVSTNSMISHLFGANDLARIPNVAQQAMRQALSFSLLGIVIAWLISPIFARAGLDPIAAAKASHYLRATVIGLPGLAIQLVLAGYSASLNRTRPMMFIALFALAINVPLNWILIYGKFGLPALGGVGCGYATAICIWASTLLLAAWIRWAPAYQSSQPLRGFFACDWAIQKQLLRLGLPIGVVFLVEVSAFSIIALLIAGLGTVPVAAHQIALNFSGLVFMIPLAVAHALTVRVGQALGAGNPQEARKIGISGLRIGLVIAVMSAVLIAYFAKGITGFYSSDDAVRKIAAQLLFFGAVFQLFDASQSILAGILRGYKVTTRPMLIYIGAFWLVGIPCGYYLAFHYGQGAAGFWQALLLALGIAAVLLYWLFAHTSRAHLAKAEG